MAIAVSLAPIKAQVGEMVRFDASKSIITANETLSKIEIKPTATSDYIDVTGTADSYGNYDRESWHLDWVYAAADDYAASVRITLDDATTTSVVNNVEVVTAATELLFSSDSDFLRNETDLYSWLPEGRNNFNYIHRESQARILDELTNKNIVEWDGDRLTVADIYNINDVKAWSKFLGLSTLFYDLSDKIDDTFWQKAKMYESLAVEARNKAIIRIGDESDEDFSSADFTTMGTIRLVR